MKTLEKLVFICLLSFLNSQGQAPKSFGNNIINVAGIENSLSNCIYINSEIIDFTDSVSTNSLKWSEIPFYTRSIDINQMDVLEISFHIPFSGNDTGNSRSRIRLTFDDTEVVSSMKYNPQPWELSDLTLSGKVYNIRKGTHTIKLMVAVDRGTFYMPHYNTALIENTLQPPLTGRFSAFGDLNMNSCSLNGNGQSAAKSGGNDSGK
jgi:hypothetical protein